MATLYIVSTGPGSTGQLTEEAREAIASARVIVGYRTYVDLILPLTAGKQVLSTGMMQEIERCRTAIALAAQGTDVALVSGGDAGIYGMAGLVFELLENDRQPAPEDRTPVEVRVIPGLSAVQAAAARLGAPLMHDFAVISLSDLLTPWQVIRSRLAAAARADFVVAIYNPRSAGRTTQIVEAQRILLDSRPPETPAGIVRNACREQETIIVTTLGDLLTHDIDMSTLVVIGNSSTFVDRCGRMVTPRGYAGKFAPGAPPPSLSVDAVAACMPGTAVMVCGTASDVGKSVITAGLCRLLLRRGIAVAPFKSQNMSLNSFVTPEGGEIGRAQAVQADACCLPPHTDMNPVLLKPNSDTGCQVILCGRPVGNMSIAEYDAFKPEALAAAWRSLERLRRDYDMVVIEGAGSIAEINLRDRDIANLKIAIKAGCPALLVADIDKGGVFAQIIGTIELLRPEERSCIRGIIINKFRGDIRVLNPGLEMIRDRTGIPVLGVLPWLPDLAIPAEDSVALGRPSRRRAAADSRNCIHAGVIRLPRISNFTDFDPLRCEPDLVLDYIDRPDQIDGLDLLIIPGSKSTIADLRFIVERGLFAAVSSFPGQIVGICGGYQMLGHRITDPLGIESAFREAEGLGLLDVATEILGEKETHQARARLQENGMQTAPGCSAELAGYEIHMGETTPVGTPRPFARIFSRGERTAAVDDGSVSPDGRVFGTYLHGIFDNDGFREAYLNRIRSMKGLPLRHGPPEGTSLPDPFDLLARHLEEHLDMDQLLKVCGV